MGKLGIKSIEYLSRIKKSDLADPQSLEVVDYIFKGGKMVLNVAKEIIF